VTAWLEYFVDGLASQMQEVKVHGERVIRADALVSRARRGGMKDRAASVLAFILDRGAARVADCEAALKLNRRTLQRDLKALVEKGFLREVGASATDPTKQYEPLL
jgi:predicted transcriptional regulator